MDDQALMDVIDRLRNRFFGKYRGVVTDVDAATISMAQSVGEGVAPAAAAQAVAAGVLANTVLKLVLAVALGDRKFGLATGAGLAATIVAIGAVFFFWR